MLVRAGELESVRPTEDAVNDRVDWFRYLVVLNGKLDHGFRIDLVNSAFELRVADGHATFTFTIDLADAASAERHVRDFLSSWEADMHLQTATSRREFRPVQVHMRSGRGMAFGPEFHLQIVGPQAEANHRREYPWQHHRYQAHSLVAGLVQRYQAYRSGQELLPVAGYFCLSAIEQSLGGGRAAVPSHLKVSAEVRKTFGDLVSRVGTFATSRKIEKNHDVRELTVAEEYWLSTALRLLIDRFGRHALGEPLGPELTMNDLPVLAP